MKITDVGTLLYGSDSGNFIIVRVATDEGLIGYGDASLCHGTSATRLAEAVYWSAMSGKPVRTAEAPVIDVP